MAQEPSQERSKVVIALQLIILAVTLLIVALIHSEILRISLSAFGLRSDVPQVALAENSCGEVFVPALAFRENNQDPPIWHQTCERQAGQTRIWHTVPRGQRSALFANESKIDIGNSQNFLVRRADVDLRQGGNRVAVLGEGLPATLPFASHHGTPVFQAPIPAHYGTRPAQNIDEFWIVRPQRVSPQNRPKEIGLGVTTGRDLWQVSTGANCMELVPGPERATCFATNKSKGIDQSGYGLVLLTEPSELKDLPAVFQRELSIDLTPSEQQMTLSFSACLSLHLPLYLQLRLEKVQTTEAIARIFGMQLHARQPFILEQRPSQGVPTETTRGPVCRTFKGKAVFPIGPVSFAAGNFLQMKGDRLDITGFGPGLETLPNGKFSSDENGMSWQGRFGAEGGVRILDWGLAQAPSDTANASRSIFGALGEVAALLPAETQAMLGGLAATLPVLVLLCVVYPRSKDRGFSRSVMPLVALTAFMVALALQPMLLGVTSWLLSGGAGLLHGLGLLDLDLATSALSVTTAHYAPLAVIAAAMMVPIIRIDQDAALPSRSNTVALWWQAVLAVLFVGLAVFFLWLQSTNRDASDLILDLVLWILLAMAYAFLLLMRTAGFLLGSGRSAMFVAAIGALALVWIPAIPAGAGAAALIRELSQISTHPQFSNLSAAETFGLKFAQQWVPNVMMVLLLAFLIGTFVAIARAFVPKSWRPENLPVGLPVLMIVAAAVLVVWPNAGDIAEGLRPFDIATYQIVGVFHDYSAYLALLVPLGLLATRTEHYAHLKSAPFGADKHADALAAAIFAGYVTIWHAGDIGFVWPFFLVTLGYYGMRNLAFARRSATTGLNASRDEDALGAKLLHVLEQTTLLSARVKALRKQFVELETSWDDLQSETDKISDIKSGLAANLEVSTSEAKRRLLNNGPLSTPFQNGLLGASFGLLMAMIIEAGSLLNLAELLEGNSGWWRPLIDLTLSGQSGTAPGPVRALDNEILSLVSAILRSVTHWPIVGFVFGVTFHRLRGDDGFTKGLVFAVLIVLLLTVSNVASGTLDTVTDGPRMFFGSMLVMITFVILLGTFGFDLFTIYQNGLSLKSITQIYGIATLFSYATVITGLTLFQSASAILAATFGS